jgi:hypothetical protein
MILRLPLYAREDEVPLESHPRQAQDRHVKAFSASGALSLAKSPEGFEEDRTKSGVNPRLIEHPGDVFAESVIGEADDPDGTPTQTARPGQIVKDLGNFDRH